MTCQDTIKQLDAQIKAIDAQIAALEPFDDDPAIAAVIAQLQAQRAALVIQLANETASCPPVANFALSAVHANKLKVAAKDFENQSKAGKTTATKQAKATLAKSKAFSKALTASKKKPS